MASFTTGLATFSLFHFQSYPVQEYKLYKALLLVRSYTSTPHHLFLWQWLIHGKQQEFASASFWSCNSLKGKDIMEVEDEHEGNTGLAIANNKGKDIMEVEDEHEGNTGLAIANNKGKDIMEVEDEHEGNTGLAIANNKSLKGKDIMDVKDEHEGNNGLAIANNKGKDIMEVEDEHEGNTGFAIANNKAEAPDWLKVLIRARFWRECRVHRRDKMLRRAALRHNRSLESVFCVNCFKVICPHCRHAEEEPTHQLLKIRRYVFRSVVSINDMKRLGVNVSHIQAYKCNGEEVVHLRPMRRSSGRTAPKQTPRCLTCDCLLHTWPNRLCSLSCKHRIRREAPASDDDLSVPGRAVRRLARRGGQSSATSRLLPGAQGEATSRPVPSARRRSRHNVANPRRDPFF
uniref:Uncharacterized protein n=1 Tax=Avena sativa TaxID=4498 RepID=A0ACD5XQ47_AVESA